MPPKIVNPEEVHLSNIESLILAQAVYEVGIPRWENVSALLSRHPMLKRPKSFWSPRTCNALYLRLMREAEFELPADDVPPKAPLHYRLAEKHWMARANELKELIAAEETKFKNVVREIEEIRSGAWDDKVPGKRERKTKTSPAAAELQREDEPPIIASPGEAEEHEVLQQKPDLKRDTSVLGEDNQEDKGTQPSPHDASPDLEEEEREDEERQDAEDASAVHATPENTRDTSSLKDTDNDKAEDSDHEEQPDIQTITAPSTPAPTDEQTAGQQSTLATPRTALETPADTPDADTDTPFSPSSPGERRREGKRKAVDGGESDGRSRKRAREDSEPVDDEGQDTGAGAGRRRRGIEDLFSHKRFQQAIIMLHAQIMEHRNGNIFHNPIRHTEAPDYREIVKRPMDLKTIKAKIRDGSIADVTEFQRDIYLMFANAMMYNGPHSDVYKMAEDTMLDCEKFIRTFKQTQGMVNRTRG